MVPSPSPSSSNGGTKGGEAPSPSSAVPLPSFLAQGTRVKIVGLRSRQDLNGLHGVIVGNEGEDRCPVRVTHADGRSESVMVKSRNLVELVEMPEGYCEWQQRDGRGGGGADVGSGASSTGGATTEDQQQAMAPRSTLAAARPRFHGDQPLLEQVLAQRKRLLELTKLRQLSMADVADHQIFLSAIEEHLVGRREDVSRRWRATEAMQHSSGMSGSRRQQLEARREGIRRAEAIFNQDLKIFNRERAWFHAQAAFKQARAHALETFKEDGTGHWCAAHTPKRSPRSCCTQMLHANVARKCCTRPPRPSPPERWASQFCVERAPACTCGVLAQVRSAGARGGERRALRQELRGDAGRREGARTARDQLTVNGN